MNSSNPYASPLTSDCIQDNDVDSLNFLIDGAITASDFDEMERLTNPSRRIQDLVLYIFLSVFLVVVLPIAVLIRAYATSAYYTLLAVCVMIPSAILVPKLLKKRKVRKLAESQIGMFAPQIVEIDWQGITGGNENVRTEFKWSTFSLTVYNEKILLLRYADGSMQLIFARHTLQPPRDWAEFTQFVHRRISAMAQNDETQIQSTEQMDEREPNIP